MLHEDKFTCIFSVKDFDKITPEMVLAYITGMVLGPDKMNGNQKERFARALFELAKIGIIAATKLEKEKDKEDGSTSSDSVKLHETNP